ncbi:MAG: hypothetical protein LUC22_00860 [Prevotella sp.]|nr:hypothetical protein [Prevotella sp.]
MFASSLRQRRVLKIIGVVLPELTHYYFSSVLSGIEEESRGRGYSLLVGSSGEESCREKEL